MQIEVGEMEMLRFTLGATQLDKTKSEERWGGAWDAEGKVRQCGHAYREDEAYVREGAEKLY